MRIGMGSLEKLLLVHHYFGSLSKVSRNSVVPVRAMGYGLSMAGRALTGTYLKNAYQTRSSEDFFYARQASVPPVLDQSLHREHGEPHRAGISAPG